MARAKKSQLSMFEGHDVIATKVAITRAGDGLSQALQIEPQELALGADVFIVMQGRVTSITMENDPDTDLVTRKHKIAAGTVTIVDEKLVKEVLDQQRIAIERAKGVERIDFGGADGEPAGE